MARHRIAFVYGGSEDDAGINLAFSKKKIDDRKEWLTNWMEERKRRNLLGLPEVEIHTCSTIDSMILYLMFTWVLPFDCLAKGNKWHL